MDLRLDGSRVLVTGATRGIGRAIVEAFAAEGAAVGFCARDGAEVAATERALGGPPRARGTVLDVASADDLRRWVASSAEQFGGIDTVVANVSALAIADGEESWRAGFEVDLMHTVHLVGAAMPYLERSPNGSIVALSSVSGRESDFASGPYGTFKTAIVGYLHGLALQLAPRGVRANVVSPGNTYFSGGVWGEIERRNPALFDQAMELNPTGRMGTPEEVAVAVVFLASPRASRITGTNLLVDGALTRGIQL